MVKVYTKGIVIWWLKTWKFAGCAFDHRIWIRPEYRNDNSLLKHEYCHVLQFERLGLLKQCFLYLYYLLKYGYKNSPLENEAEKFSHTYHGELPLVFID